jgi:hypothetical protein
MIKECCFNCIRYNGSDYKGGGGKLYCGADKDNPKSIEKNVKSYKCGKFKSV